MQVAVASTPGKADDKEAKPPKGHKRSTTADKGMLEVNSSLDCFGVIMQFAVQDEFELFFCGMDLRDHTIVAIA